jgi:hypothetical protein
MMAGAEPPVAVRRFFDVAGRLARWPARRKFQKPVLGHLAQCFEPGRRYTEREVNELLRQSHTFGDWVMLRRALIDECLLERLSDGSAYWRVASPAEPDA